MDDEYDKGLVTDMPSATVRITLDDRTKEVYHYFGDPDAPDSLSELEDKIDETVGVERWVGIN